MQHDDLSLGVSEFVAYVNQTFEIAYPQVAITGEVSNYRVSKNRWVYFDIKDEAASMRCFATVQALPGPLEDGMMVRISGHPRLHPLYNFSFQVQSVVPVGEGNLRKAANLLALKLEAEGLFEDDRKRPLAYPPKRIALITAIDSAAYADFVKIIDARWGGVQIDFFSVLVQGEKAADEIVAALKTVNEFDTPAEVAVLVRGGGSAEDLAVWSDERVVRAIAGSRVPTLVAIGHEVDVSLAELAADRRASTPSNAAELLVPDKRDEQRYLKLMHAQLDQALEDSMLEEQDALAEAGDSLHRHLQSAMALALNRFEAAKQLLAAYDPERPLRQGYAVVYNEVGSVVSRAGALQDDEVIQVKFTDGIVTSQVKYTHKIEEET